MARKRMKIFDSKWFSLVIAVLIFGMFFALFSGTKMLQNLEGTVIDLHFQLKTGRETKTIQEGAVLSHQNLKISDNILILGIDQRSLAEYGKWPFTRTKHAELINSFSRISDQSNREQALFLDVFFIEEDQNPTNDALLVNAINDSGKVFLETVLTAYGSMDEEDPLLPRQEALYEQLGVVEKIQGDWKGLPAHYGYEPPLEPYGRAAAGYGHANFLSDPDQVFRRQPLLLRSSILLRTLRLDDLSPGYAVNEAAFERLAWQDDQGHYHDIENPISASDLARLQLKMEKDAPLKIVDDNYDGIPDDKIGRASCRERV